MADTTLCVIITDIIIIQQCAFALICLVKTSATHMGLQQLHSCSMQ
jgi:hypothetical protein